jgi:hypothetical protein|tara:strand:+ start:260 stop:721 length:462 start_codon:yes stop_codon:yes gene_type:complete
MNRTTSHESLSRRSFLTAGTLGVGGLALSDFLRLRAEAGKPKVAPDTSVIFVWLAGGPPHMETYDMKPDAPSDYRGLFSPIRTNVPGIDVCELLPMHAKCTDKYTLIRSIAHTFNDHGGGWDTYCQTCNATSRSGSTEAYAGSQTGYRLIRVP